MTDHGVVELWKGGNQSTLIMNGKMVKNYFGLKMNQEEVILELSNE